MSPANIAGAIAAGAAVLVLLFGDQGPRDGRGEIAWIGTMGVLLLAAIAGAGACLGLWLAGA